MNILQTRLFNQHLTGPLFSNATEAVSWFGAVQSQDYSNAKWAVGQRIKNANDKLLEKAFINGEILRTHVMRPTWHFVTPIDIKWMLKLTAPRVKSIMNYYNKILGLDKDVFQKSQRVFEQALKNKNYLTRAQLNDSLTKNKINVKGQTLAHIVMEAELDGVICSGPRIGKQFSYALIKERAPSAKNLSFDESLSELAKRYFQSHAPATISDFVWWSGLTTPDAKKGIEANKPKIESENLNGNTYWFFRSSPAQIPKNIYLLPNYDEYTIAYKLRDDFYDRKKNPSADAKGALYFPHTMIREGKIIGMWRRELKKNEFEFEYTFFSKFTNPELKSLEDEVKSYSDFFGVKINIKR